MSTWPVAGGVVVKDGTLYAAAGIASYDGTHVYALDAITGKLKWYNDSSGELSEKSQAGISLQGNLYVRDVKLCFAGGNAYKIAAYDLETGKCLTPVRDRGKATIFEAYYPEIASPVLERDLPGGRLLLYNRDSRFSWVRGKRMVLLGPFPPDAKPMEKYRMMERKQGRKVLWSKSGTSEFQSFIVGSDAVLAARGTLARDRLVLSNPSLVAFDPKDGSQLWTHPLPAEPVKWGTAVDHRGRIFVSTKDGRVVSLEPANPSAGG